MIEAKELSPKIRRLAVERFADSLNNDLETDEERDAALKIIEILAPMPQQRALLTLALAKLSTMPESEGQRWAQRILAS